MRSHVIINFSRIRKIRVALGDCKGEKRNKSQLLDFYSFETKGYMRKHSRGRPCH